MELWKTDTPALQVPEAILIQTLEKGTLGLAQRRKEEYRLWENSKCTGIFIPELLDNQINSLQFKAAFRNTIIYDYFVCQL